MYEVRGREQSYDNKDNAKCDDRSKHDNTSTLGKEGLTFLSKSIGLHYSCYKETDTQIVDENGYQPIEKNHTKESNNPSHIPL